MFEYQHGKTYQIDCFSGNEMITVEVTITKAPVAGSDGYFRQGRCVGPWQKPQPGEGVAVKDGVKYRIEIAENGFSFIREPISNATATAPSTTAAPAPAPWWTSVRVPGFVVDKDGGVEDADGNFVGYLPEKPVHIQEWADNKIQEDE